ncbi:hypothetical protein EVAR_67512_1 [Eumeta japonica]|uniref:Uncharacterized protein n=1 Tax=Eumeta variegata TaxID=151549 RepID=A0A4C2A7Z9_EUMVA|nr:hypothetical protein EVAR_67512_1 [Eumeta japonica]
MSCGNSLPGSQTCGFSLKSLWKFSPGFSSDGHLERSDHTNKYTMHSGRLLSCLEELRGWVKIECGTKIRIKRVVGNGRRKSIKIIFESGAGIDSGVRTGRVDSGTTTGKLALPSDLDDPERSRETSDRRVMDDYFPVRFAGTSAHWQG